MCTKLSFITSSEQVYIELNIQPDGLLRTNFNIAPTQHTYIIRNTNPEQLDFVTWGIIPYWSISGKNEGKLTHARAENISTSTSFRIPIRQKRCLILVDSFYDLLENQSKKSKEAYRFFSPKNELLTIAGIWDVWLKDNYELKSFSIITCKENDDWQNRMPVIIANEEDRKNWLSEIPISEVLEYLKPPSKDNLDFYKISTQAHHANNTTLEMHVKI